MEKNQLYRYTGNESQLFGLRRVRLDEGRAGGLSVIEATTAGGLQVDILPDAGLDLGLVRFKGVNVSFLSKNGYDGPAVNQPFDDEFMHSFPGGLLYTCGLRSVGPAGDDGGEWHPHHGRIHRQQATGVCAAAEGGDLVVSGTLRESALFGHLLQLHRRITIPAFGSRITVEDTIENLTPRAEPFMLLYHCNFGYPLLSETARLVLPAGRQTTPRDDFSKKALGRECTVDPPADGEPERSYFHQMDEPRARLENPAVRVAATLAWSADSLPVFAQWRSMASGDYVLGLEPANNHILGRAAERENGTLPTIGAFGRVCTKIEFSFETLG